jgi:hypothetical protein
MAPAAILNLIQSASRLKMAVLIERKNVLRVLRGGFPRLDFQRTRASKSDPCSRYYRPRDFHVVAACLHAVTEQWEYRFMPTSKLQPHHKCPGRLHNTLSIDEKWHSDPADAFLAVGNSW